MKSYLIGLLSEQNLPILGLLDLREKAPDER